MTKSTKRKIPKSSSIMLYQFDELSESTKKQIVAFVIGDQDNLLEIVHTDFYKCAYLSVKDDEKNLDIYVPISLATMKALREDIDKTIKEMEE
jgi:hypothetical protein